MARTPREKNLFSQERAEAAEIEIIERSRRIDFYMTEYSVEYLADKMNQGRFVIPEYQREFTWESERQSRFIESIIMGLPIPFIFFWEMETGQLEIVDGSQRLRTIQHYVNNDLKLTELEELPSISHTYFSDLLPSRQNKILNRSIRGIVLNEHADDQARFDMFERINTGSKVTNTAEVRRGALRGPFQDMVTELADSEILGRLAPISRKSKNERINEELVARFFAYGDGLENYKDSPSRFIFDYTKKMNEKFIEEAELSAIYRRRFYDTLDFVERVFPNGFKKTAGATTTPRVRFEAIAIGSYLALKINPQLDQNWQEIDISTWIDGAEFKKRTTSDAANVKSKLQNRMDYVKDALIGAL